MKKLMTVAQGEHFRLANERHQIAQAVAYGDLGNANPAPITAAYEKQADAAIELQLERAALRLARLLNLVPNREATDGRGCRAYRPPLQGTRATVLRQVNGSNLATRWHAFPRVVRAVEGIGESQLLKRRSEPIAPRRNHFSCALPAALGMQLYHA